MKCAVGYSNILFGIMMLEALMGGERYQSVFGIVKVKKVYVPAIMMIIIQISMPQASLVGHFAGIISALVLKKTGLHYLLLPRQSWI
jgi:membrane associated rhomboid family serine protease